jgi:two-component system NtrC family sensor kinase
MKKIYLLVILFFAIANGLKAQNNQPQAFEIKADTAINEDISDKYWQLLEDPTGKLDISQVSSAAYNLKFHGNTTLTKGYNYAITNYWLRYKLRDSLTYPVKVTIPEGVAYAWLYIPAANGKWDVEKTGKLLPWGQRGGLKRVTQFVVTLQPGQEVLLYEHDIFDFAIYKPENFRFTIGFYDAVINSSYLNDDAYYYKNCLSFLIIGIFLLAFLINLFFYRVVRERLYLYFSFFLIFISLYYLLATDIGLLREHPYIYYYDTEFIVMGLFFTLMHFIRKFLATKEKTPKWDKFLVLLSYLVIIVLLRRWYLPPTMPYRTYLVFQLLIASVEYLYMPVILVTLLYYIFKSKRDERTGMYALLPVFLWWSIAYTFTWLSSELSMFFHVPYTPFYNWIESSRFMVEFFCFLWLVMVFSWILFKRFQVLQQSVAQAALDKERLEKEQEMERNRLIELQKDELEHQVENRTIELKKSIEDLKNTQRQLIQSEKMASLGELTAGIAHEIQNPLNFVNNFSEVNTELIDELQQEIDKGAYAEVKVIAVDIKANQQKINMHGKRADAIVKSMLEHSRTNTGEKELTNINMLADEFFKLAYHGLRAKDKSFHSEMKTHFDKDLPKIEAVQQDIGRVLLNLFNNAFYAVNKKSKTAGAAYKPTVEVSTSTKNGQIEIKVKDNGNGIPDNIKDKIMQPFFTTKPTGEGTGLGLSLSYDIIAKGHSGKIDVKSEEGNYTEFIITIPA